jgi:hypothetical protein
MYSRLLPPALAALIGVAGLSGCHSCCNRGTTSAQSYCANCVDTIQPPRIAPVPMPYGPPAVASEPPPAPAAFLAPGPQGRPPAAELGTPIPTPPPDNGSARTQRPPVVRLLPPGPRRESARVPPDSTKEPPLANVPEKPAPRVDEDRETPAPIDIPGFALARPNVSTGLRPFPDGIDWLKARGYKVVLHLRAPGEDNTAAQRQFEKKGLRYESLEVSPARLSKELYESFIKQVSDTNSHPLFVYDKDGSVAGGLWYLYFRVYHKQSDEKARAEAERLGLRFDEDVEHKTMWLAVQTLLKKLLPSG